MESSFQDFTSQQPHKDTDGSKKYHQSQKKSTVHCGIDHTRITSRPMTDVYQELKTRQEHWGQCQQINEKRPTREEMALEFQADDGPDLVQP